MRRVNPIHARAQAGVGLIEVLIALLVLSIGMLGMAGLQMWSLQNNQGSMERGMAVMQTHTIADAMRAARTTATANGFDVGLDEDIDEVEGGTAYATAALRAWRTGLTENLGEDATGAVECDGAVCDITIQWRDRQVRPAEGDPEGEEAEADEALQQLTTTVRL